MLNESKARATAATALALAIALSLALLAIPGIAQAGGAPSTARALDTALDRIAAARDGPPGLSVLIQRGSRAEFRRRGVADLRTGRRPTRDDPYRIASMAKA